MINLNGRSHLIRIFIKKEIRKAYLTTGYTNLNSKPDYITPRRRHDPIIQKKGKISIDIYIGLYSLNLLHTGSTRPAAEIQRPFASDQWTFTSFFHSSLYPSLAQVSGYLPYQLIPKSLP